MINNLSRGVMKRKLKVCWISAGVSSFMAGYLAKDVDEFIYIDIEDQHPDSMRFIKDCEKVLGKEIKIIQSEYKSVENACRGWVYKQTNSRRLLYKIFKETGKNTMGIRT